MLLEERNYFLLEMASTTEKLNNETTLASTTINNLTTERDDTLERLREAESINDSFEKQLDKLSGTVGTLDKLAKTDEELLQKYSKVYFLSEHYRPTSLKQINKENVVPGKGDQYFHASALPYLVRMIAAAKKDEIDLQVVSAYRSFETQAELKGTYLQTYGSGANTFSADQGYSEHQLGTAVDLASKNSGLDGFGQSAAFPWLQKNAYKYGFILSYPEGNSYYMYEPWHWRFVGEDLANDLHKDNTSFYDWDQRKINEYLVKIFD
jgi:LAS superfamily LD-carboxypeptidase LdcB